MYSAVTSGIYNVLSTIANADFDSDSGSYNRGYEFGLAEGKNEGAVEGYQEGSSGQERRDLVNIIPNYSYGNVDEAYKEGFIKGFKESYLTEYEKSYLEGRKVYAEKPDEGVRNGSQQAGSLQNVSRQSQQAGSQQGSQQSGSLQKVPGLSQQVGSQTPTVPGLSQRGQSVEQPSQVTFQVLPKPTSLTSPLTSPLATPLATPLTSPLATPLATPSGSRTSAGVSGTVPSGAFGKPVKEGPTITTKDFTHTKQVYVPPAQVGTKSRYSVDDVIQFTTPAAGLSGTGNPQVVPETSGLTPLSQLQTPATFSIETVSEAGSRNEKNGNGEETVFYSSPSSLSNNTGKDLILFTGLPNVTGVYAPSVSEDVVVIESSLGDIIIDIPGVTNISLLNSDDSVRFADNVTNLPEQLSGMNGMTETNGVNGMSLAEQVAERLRSLSQSSATLSTPLASRSATSATQTTQARPSTSVTSVTSQRTSQSPFTTGTPFTGQKSFVTKPLELLNKPLEFKTEPIFNFRSGQVTPTQKDIKTVDEARRSAGIRDTEGIIVNKVVQTSFKESNDYLDRIMAIEGLPQEAIDLILKLKQSRNDVVIKETLINNGDTISKFQSVNVLRQSPSRISGTTGQTGTQRNGISQIGTSRLFAESRLSLPRPGITTGPKPGFTFIPTGVPEIPARRQSRTSVRQVGSSAGRTSAGRTSVGRTSFNPQTTIPALSPSLSSVSSPSLSPSLSPRTSRIPGLSQTGQIGELPSAKPLNYIEQTTVLTRPISLISPQQFTTSRTVLAPRTSASLRKSFIPPPPVRQIVPSQPFAPSQPFTPTVQIKPPFVRQPFVPQTQQGLQGQTQAQVGTQQTQTTLQSVPVVIEELGDTLIPVIPRNIPDPYKKLQTGMAYHIPLSGDEWNALQFVLRDMEDGIIRPERYGDYNKALEVYKVLINIYNFNNYLREAHYIEDDDDSLELWSLKYRDDLEEAIEINMQNNIDNVDYNKVIVSLETDKKAKFVIVSNIVERFLNNLQDPDIEYDSVDVKVYKGGIIRNLITPLKLMTDVPSLAQLGFGTKLTFGPGNTLTGQQGQQTTQQRTNQKQTQQAYNQQQTYSQQQAYNQQQAYSQQQAQQAYNQQQAEYQSQAYNQQYQQEETTNFSYLATDLIPDNGVDKRLVVSVQLPKNMPLSAYLSMNDIDPNSNYIFCSLSIPAKVIAEGGRIYEDMGNGQYDDMTDVFMFYLDEYSYVVENQDNPNENAIVEVEDAEFLRAHGKDIKMNKSFNVTFLEFGQTDGLNISYKANRTRTNGNMTLGNVFNDGELYFYAINDY